MSEKRRSPETEQYKFFSHTACEYFPCHPGADPSDFNCLFCYCPLYALGEDCGGNFRYTSSGLKDCTNCRLPHLRRSYSYVTGKYREIAKLTARKKEEPKDPGEKE